MRDRRGGLVTEEGGAGRRPPRLLMGCGEPLGGGPGAVPPSRGKVPRRGARYAARLIESIGLKGYRLGGAQVSEKHANFIINTGAASARDIANLIAHVRDQVEQETGVRLVPEVRMVDGGNA